MRQDSPAIALAAQARNKEPRYVVGIIYPTSSPYFTSRTGLTNVPGVPVQGVLEDLGGTSQEIDPAEGRSTIGGFTFRVTDLDGAMTAELRSQLSTNDTSPRRREVRVLRGYTNDFNNYARVGTFMVDTIKLVGASYEVSCTDIQRQMRDRIFEVKKTRLTATISAADTTLNVLSTAAFQTVLHTAAFSDAPSTTVGYLKIKKTGEIIRYTGKTSTTFTGCTRERFNTVAQAIEVDGGTEDDRLPEIEEFIYLEGPMPLLARAILTGVLDDTPSAESFLPDHWHVGIDESYVRVSEFETIGTDLYDPADLNAGLVGRFTHLDGVDGKAFIERELMVPMGAFLFVDANGTIGPRRLARILTDAAHVATFTEDNVVEASEVEHDQNSVINQAVVEWNYDGEEFTRSGLLQDLDSIARNGLVEPMKLALRGIAGSRHTNNTVHGIFRSIVDRYGEPPLRMSVKLLPSMDRIEVGDVVRVTLGWLRDYQGTGTLNRSFEVQAVHQEWLTGGVQLDLFGTARESPAPAPSQAAAAIPDAWYNSEGTALSTVLTIVGNAVTVDGSLTGNADLNASGAIYYHLGNLTINTGVTVSFTQNVQLRIRGTLTINGTLSGVGGGIAAITDPSSEGGSYTFPSAQIGRRETFGTTRSSAGLFVHTGGVIQEWLQVTLTGVEALPPYTPAVVSSALTGLPSELRGTPGIFGAPIVEVSTLHRKGSAGGAGGAGIAIIARGYAFGVNGRINTSGANGAAPTSLTFGSHTLYPGGGGGGAPGGVLLVADGGAILAPDLTSVVLANRGSTTQTGNQIWLAPPDNPAYPWTGRDPGLGAENLWRSAHQFVYALPAVATGATDDEIVPAPTSLSVVGDTTGVFVSWVPPPPGTYDTIEVWWATTNDRTGAVKLAERPGSSLYHASQTRQRRYFWIRARKNGRGVSAWHPTGSTSGVPALFGGAEYDLVEDFVYLNPTELHARWTQRESGIPDGDIASTAFADVPNGMGMRFGNTSGNDEWWAALTAVLLPYDPAETYEVGIIWRHVSGSGQLYMGVEGYDDDGVTQIDRSGGSSYTIPHFVAANAFVGSGAWQASRGYLRGLGSSPVVPSNNPNVPSVARTGVAYIRPVVLLNYSNAAGVVDVARVWIRRLPTLGTPNLGANSAATTYFTSDTTETVTEPGGGSTSALIISVNVDSPDTLSYIEVTASFQLRFDPLYPTADFLCDLRVGRSSTTTSYSQPLRREGFDAAPDYDIGAVREISMSYSFQAQVGTNTVSLGCVLQSTTGVSAIFENINLTATLVKR